MGGVESFSVRACVGTHSEKHLFVSAQFFVNKKRKHTNHTLFLNVIGSIEMGS